MATGTLYMKLPALTKFTFTVTGLYSTTTGVDNGSVTMRLIDIWGTVQSVVSFSITSVATDYSMTYDNVIYPIARAEMYCTDTTFGDTLFYLSGGLQITNVKNLYWLGWAKADNMVRSFRNPSYPIQVSAADGLADLKNVKFPVSASTTGYATYIQLVKTCLAQNGIALPIKTQCNIIENALMTGATDTLFNVVEANPVRFTDDADGRLTTISNYDALSYLLQPFNCYITQIGGYWYIGAPHEISSKQTIFEWHTSALAYTTNRFDRTLDITNCKIITDSDELSKMPPLGEVELTFRNYSSTLNNSVVNGTFDSDITGWHNSGSLPWDTFAWSSNLGGSLQCESTGSNALNPHLFSGSSMNLSGSSSGNYFTFYCTIETDVEFGDPSVIIPDVLHPRTLNPQIQFLLKNPTGGTYADSRQRLVDGVKVYGLANPNAFPFKNDGNYTLEIMLTPDGSSPYTSYDVYFDNIKLFGNTSSNTFDHFYQATINNTSSVNVGQFVTYFGDSIQSNTSGNLTIGNGIKTSVWSTNSGTTENLSLQQLFNKLKLTESGSFRDYLRFTIKDNASINFNNALQINSKKYNVSNYSYDLLNNKLDLELAEILTTAPTSINYSDTTLSTIDGK